MVKSTRKPIKKKANAARPPRPPVDDKLLAAEVRKLLFGGRSGALSTTMRGREAWPYGSLVTFSLDVDGSPLFLFSTLSDHTNNLAKDGKASLLVEAASNLKNPQRGPRASFLGRVTPSKSPRIKRRFLARHPDAAMYAGFGDFGFYKMTIERIHLVGGFARARWMKPKDVFAPGKAVKAIQSAEDGIIEHMNDDHSDALDLYANRLLGRKGTGWKAIGCDPWGLDLMRSGYFARLTFDQMVRGPGDLRGALVDLAAKARAKS